MKKHLFYISFMLIAFVLSVSNSGATEDGDKNNLLKSFEKMQNNDWKFRKNEIDLLEKNNSFNNKLTNEEITLIINIFDIESKFKYNYIKDKKNKNKILNDAEQYFNSEIYTQGYRGYYIEFAKIVAGYKDKRAINALLRSISNYGGEINPSHIILIGEEAVDILLAACGSDEIDIKNMAYFVLSNWVNAPISTDYFNITEDQTIKNKYSLEKIKKLFLSSLDDTDIDIRSMAVYGLKAFPEKNVINKLKIVAEKDSYSFYSKFKGEYVFPIRSDAINVIKELENKTVNP